MINTRRKFTVNFKLNCIRQYEEIKNCRKVARQNGVNRATLRNWIKHKILLENVKHKRMVFVEIFLII